MTSMLGIVAGISAVLAVVVGSLFIGVCLAVAWISDRVLGRGRPGVPGEGDRRAVAPSPARGRHRGVSGGPVVPGRGGQ